MASVHTWTGLETRALRHALRMSVRAFADHLSVAVNTVSKWEKQLAAASPRPDSQAILDTALARAAAAAKERFERLLTEQGAVARHWARTVPVVTMSEYETWTEDMERAVVGLSRQDFDFAGTLLERWLQRVHPRELDERGLYLYARSLTLFGDLRRLQGTICDLMTAKGLYADAHSMFLDLDIPRRAAQIELSLAIVAEMSSRLTTAASQYTALAGDERLSTCDRARARLWFGTPLTKQGCHESAIRIMRATAQHLDDLAEPEDWAMAQQKLALAHRGTGDLTRALRYIETARSARSPNSPLEHVQLDTAHAHILLTDRATRDEGQATLARAAATADRYGLQHQLRSIDNIRTHEEYA